MRKVNKLSVNGLELMKLLDDNTDHIELVSYGLAPNPNGFCYEKKDTLPKEVEIEINNLLECLNKDDEKFFRAFYL